MLVHAWTAKRGCLADSSLGCFVLDPAAAAVASSAPETRIEQEVSQGKTGDLSEQDCVKSLR